MVCKNCNTVNPDGALFCASCGTRFEAEKPVETAYAPVEEPVYAQPPVNQYSAQPVYNQPPVQQPQVVVPLQNVGAIPTTGQYFLWFLIPCIPLIGWILMIVFACMGSEPARARFYRGWILFSIIPIVILIILFLVTGFSFAAFADYMF